MISSAFKMTTLGQVSVRLLTSMFQRNVLLPSLNWEGALLFLYFFTLSAELLHIEIFVFKPRINHLLCVLLLSVSLFFKGFIRFDKKLITGFFLILFSMIFSGICGFEPKRSLGYVLVFIFTFWGYFYLPAIVGERLGYKKVLKIYFGSFIIMGIYSLLQVVFSKAGVILPFVTQYAISIARGQGMCYEPSYYALYMTGFVMLYNAQKLYDVDKPIRWLSFLGVNLLLICSTSTGIIFSYPLFIFLYFLTGVLTLTSPHVQKVIKRTGIMFLFFALLMISLFVLFPADFLITFYKFFDLGFTKHWSITARFEGIVNAISVFIEHTLFGVGIGGVGPYLFDMFEHGAVAEGLLEVERYDPTNAATELLASLGLVGLLGYGVLIWRFWQVFKMTMHKSLHITVEERRLAIAFMLSVVCSLCVLQFNQGLFRSYIWLHAGLCFGYLNCLLNKTNKTVGE